MTAVLRNAPAGEDLVSPISCLPWWHDQFTDPNLQQEIAAGVGHDAEGNVNADPEQLREAAERKLGRGYLPLAAYTLARYGQSEVGSGTPEEKMAVIQAAINRARRAYPQLNIEDGVNRLLLRRTCVATTKYPLAPGACGRYGPIHASETRCARLDRKKGCAPYGRWAATSKDPTIQTLLIARFALAGTAGQFARGANDQFGPDAARSILNYDDAKLAGWIRRKASDGDYWIGPLAGINPRHTLLFAHRPGTPIAKALVNAAIRAVAAPKPRVPTVVCPRPGTAQPPPRVASRRSPVAVASIAGIATFLALSAGVGLWTATRAEQGKLFPWY